MGTNQLCMYGVGADSNEGDLTYANWGTMMAIQMARSDDDGKVIEPFDAESLGITDLRFTITGVSGQAPVRLGVALVSTEEIPFEDQPFVIGDAPSDDLTADGTYTVTLSKLVLAWWTSFLDLCTGSVSCDFDGTRIHSVQFQFVTAPTGPRPYDFCVSDLTWLDTAGEEVSLP